MVNYPPVNPHVPFMWHGGDYNPEQWSPEVWAEDFRLMQQAGISVATIGVFSWVSLQPSEDRFTFAWLDQVMDGLHQHGIKVALATPSAAQPAWLSEAYPEVLRAEAHGVRNRHVGRTNYCPNSPVYRNFSGAIARRLAERYKDHPALILWHVSNEYAGACYCETCAARFRDWLKIKYGTLDELNRRWWTAFWSHTYTDWSQIRPPLANGETLTHGLTIDYFRFMSDSQLACYRNERDILRGITPDIPITTNLMGSYKPLDYRRWAKELDVVAWDCYPNPNHTAGEIAFAHDLMRGLKDGQPFLLIEQTPSSANWQAVNALKRPGVLRLWSYLAMAHGAESVMYFQWRRSRGGSEKFHGAIVEHSGRTDTRVFREVSQIGAELTALGDSVIGTGIESKIAILFDWDNWHALDGAIGPIREKRYVETVRQHYLAFYKRNVSVDIVFPDSDFSKYAILVAPMLHMIKPGVAEKIEKLVEAGGAFITTTLSGIVDETDLAFEGGYPGPLRKLMGMWVEEIDALYEDQPNEIVVNDRRYACTTLADLIRLEGAEVLATYGHDFYAGAPAVTQNTYGQGSAYYMGTLPESAFLEAFYGKLCQQYGIAAPLTAPTGVEIAVRGSDDRRVIFVLNHTATPSSLNIDSSFKDLLSGESFSESIPLEAYGVRILREL
jgi:beta-galactosidase